MKERFCYVCGDKLLFKHYIANNLNTLSKNDKKFFVVRAKDVLLYKGYQDTDIYKQWDSSYTQFLCCTHYAELKKLDNIAYFKLSEANNPYHDKLVAIRELQARCDIK